jgi:hypothetical protein
VREQSLNLPGNPTTKLYRISCRNAFSLSPYSAIFCLQSSRLFDHNHKKANTLPKSAQNSGPKCTANSLFRNILRVSPSGSIFYPECLRSAVRNINKMSILQSDEEKNWKVSLAARGTARVERTGNRGMSHAPLFPARDPSLRLKSGYAQDDASQENCASLLPSKKRRPAQAAFPQTITHGTPVSVYALGSRPCWKWYCRMRAASAGLKVLPL